MGWGSPPKPDKKLIAAQQSEADRAKADRIELVQGQLGLEDQLRAQIYGRRSGADTGQGNGGGDGYGNGGGGYGYGGGGFGHGGWGGLLQ